jgi:hypothetical protein
VFPNPSPATFRRIPNGVINLRNEQSARYWVHTDHAGVVISLTNIFRPFSGGPVKAFLKVYDAVGNIVNQASTGEGGLLANNNDLSTRQQTVDVYWNGSNSRGMMCAPGVYRIVVYIQYPPVDGLPDERFIMKVGISK